MEPVTRWIAKCKVRCLNNSDVWLSKFRSVWAETAEEAEAKILAGFISEGRLPGVRDFKLDRAD